MKLAVPKVAALGEVVRRVAAANVQMNRIDSLEHGGSIDPKGAVFIC